MAMTLKAVLSLDTGKFTGGVKDASSSLDDFRGEVDKLKASSGSLSSEFEKQIRELEKEHILLTQGAEAARRFENGIKGMSSAEVDLIEKLRQRNAAMRESEAGTDMFGASLGRLKPLAAAVGGALAAISVADLATFMVDSYRETEKFSAVLKTATGSVGEATALLEVLREFAAKTPYDLRQAVDGFVMLKNMGLDASIASMESYGNTATAMSKDLSQMIEAVADASNYQFERLVEFGIKTEQEGDKVKFTFQGVTTEVEKNARAIQQYLLDIGNTKFAGAMAEQANTLNGILSELKDNAAAVSARFMEQSGSANALKASLSGLSGVLKSLSSDMGNVVQSPDELLQSISNGQADTAIAQIKQLGDEFKTASQDRRVVIRDELMNFYQALQQQQSEYAAAIQSASQWKDGMLGGLADKVIGGDATRLAETAKTLAAIDEVFKNTASVMNPAYWDTLGQAQKPVWEGMASGAQKAGASVNSLASSMGKAGASWLPDVVKYKDEISAAAAQFAVDARLVQAVMMQESIRAAKARGVSPETIGSPAGAKGMMQLMPGTADEMAKELNMTGYSLYNAADNIKLGTAYLSKQLYAFNGDVEQALAAYNAGPGAVRKYGGVPPYAETQEYVKQIMSDYRSLNGETEKLEKKRLSEVSKARKAAASEAEKEATAIRKAEDERSRSSQKILADLDAIDMKRQGIRNALDTEVEKAGASTLRQAEIDLMNKGFQGDDLQAQAAKQTEAALRSLQRQTESSRMAAILGAEAFREWELVNEEGFIPSVAAAQTALEREAAQLGQFRQIWEQVMSKTEEAFLSTVMTGKGDWGGLIDYMIQEATRLYVIKPLMDSLFGNGSMGAGGGSIGSFVGGLLGFSSGGYTGGGSTSAVAGVVHGQEFVVNAAATRQNRPVLEAMNAGGRYMSSAPTAVAVDVRPQVNIRVDNRAGVKVSAEQQADSTGALNVTLLIDQVEGAITDRARRGTGLANVFKRVG